MGGASPNHRIKPDRWRACPECGEQVFGQTATLRTHRRTHLDLTPKDRNPPCACGHIWADHRRLGAACRLCPEGACLQYWRPETLPSEVEAERRRRLLA
jgi:hypothetical protein